MTTSRRSLWYILIVATVVGGTYSTALPGAWVWDDHSLIQQQRVIQEIQPLYVYFTQPMWSVDQSNRSAPYYRPLTIFSFALDHAVSGGDVRFFQLTNIILHVFVCLLLFSLLVQWTGRHDLAAFMAAGFGVMPRLTETVAWISGRGDILATFWLLVAVRLSCPGRNGERRPVLVGMAMLCAFLSKEVAVFAVPAVLILAITYRGAPAVLPIAASLAAYFGLRFGVAGVGATGAGLSLDPLPIAEKMGQYVLNTILFHRPSIAQSVLDFSAAARGIAFGIACLAGLAFLFRGRTYVERQQRLSMATLAFATVLVVSGLFDRISSFYVNDRFLYVPMVAVGVCLAMALGRANRSFFAPVLLAFVVVCVPITMQRNTLWQDELSLWDHDISEATNIPPIALQHYGWALVRESYPRQAIVVFERALRESKRDLTQGGQNSVLARGTAYSDIGNFADGEHLLRQLAPGPGQGLSVAQYNLALLLARSGRFDESIAMLQGLLDNEPNYRGGRSLLGLVQQARITLESDTASDRDIIRTWAMLGNATRAIEIGEARVRSGDRELVPLLANLQIRYGSIERATELISAMVESGDRSSAGYSVNLMRERHQKERRVQSLPWLQSLVTASTG